MNRAQPLSMGLAASGLLSALAALVFAGCEDKQNRSADSDDATDSEVGSDTSAPFDFVPYARLVASDTRATDVGGGHVWIHGTRDAIGGVRDDSANSCWSGPSDHPSSVSIDLQPWLGRELSLSDLTIDIKATATPAVEVVLREGCGGTVRFKLPWSDTSRSLALGDRSAGCVDLRFVPAGAFTVCAISLKGRAAGAPLPDADSRLPKQGATAAQWSGVIEGFYGQPWSWRERENMIRLLSAVGLQIYVYAPKDDLFQRFAWRLPYKEKDLARLAELARFAKTRDVTFCMGLSPFVTFDYDADFAKAKDKLASFVDFGAPCIALMADDIEWDNENIVIDGNLGALHTKTVNDLRAELLALDPELEMLFVPTVYYSEQKVEGGDRDAYLAALAGLDPAVQVLWTGKEVLNAQMDPEHIAPIAAAADRSPLIWDNFWANDFSDDVEVPSALHLAPFSGRDANLLAAVSGIAHNPANQGALDRLGIATLGRYVSDPANYEPLEAAAAARELEGAFSFYASADSAADRDLLELVTAIWNGHAARPPLFEALAKEVAALRPALESGKTLPFAAAREALTLFGSMAAVQSSTHHSGLEPELVDELIYPLERVRFDGEAGLAGLALLGERLANREGKEQAAIAKQALAQADQCRYEHSAGLVASLVLAIEGYARRDAGFAAPRPSESEMPPCVTAAKWSWQPFAGASQLFVYGLPGAAIEKEVVRFTPRHSGTYRAIAVGFAEGKALGWRALDREIICRAAQR